MRQAHITEKGISYRGRPRKPKVPQPAPRDLLPKAPKIRERIEKASNRPREIKICPYCKKMRSSVMFNPADFTEDGYTPICCVCAYEIKKSTSKRKRTQDVSGICHKVTRIEEKLKTIKGVDTRSTGKRLVADVFDSCYALVHE